MEDSTIVQMYWDRDENAISATSEKYGPYCISIARNILESHEDAEECVSDAYLNTWNSIPSNRPELLSAYLGKIVRNLSFNRYKKNRAKKRGKGEVAVVLDELEEVIADSKTPEAEWNRNFLVECINGFLAELPENKRNLFVCRYWYSDSVKDIAKNFGMTETNVSVTLKRLREKLHSYLMEKGVEL